MNIEYVDHSLGNRYKDHIELNVHLKEYPELHDNILNHELEHTDKNFSKEDIKLDLKPSTIDKFKLLKFMLRHPKSFYQFLPFYWTKRNGFVFDISLIFVYAALLFCVMIGFFLAR